jgi:hypothetical protein
MKGLSEQYGVGAIGVGEERYLLALPRQTLTVDDDAVLASIGMQTDAVPDEFKGEYAKARDQKPKFVEFMQQMPPHAKIIRKGKVEFQDLGQSRRDGQLRYQPELIVPGFNDVAYPVTELMDGSGQSAARIAQLAGELKLKVKDVGGQNQVSIGALLTPGNSSHKLVLDPKPADFASFTQIKAPTRLTFALAKLTVGAGRSNPPDDIDGGLYLHGEGNCLLFVPHESGLCYFIGKDGTLLAVPKAGRIPEQPKP